MFKKTSSILKKIVRGICFLVKFFALCILFMFSLAIVHEFGHCISSFLLHGNCVGIGIVINNFENDIIQMYTYCNVPDKIGWGIVLIAGSITALLISVMLIIYLYKKNPTKHAEKIIILIWCMISEFIYWFTSYFQGRGDAYLLITLFELDLITFYLYLILGYTILIVFIVFMMYLLIKKEEEKRLYSSKKFYKDKK